MRKIFPIILLCVCIGACGKPDYSVKFDPSERVTVGVMDFVRNSNDVSLEPYRKGLTDMFIIELQKMPELQAVLRSRLETVMSEFELGELGVIDPETAQKIGRVLGAQAMYMGSFTSYGTTMRLSAYLIRVETWAVLFGDEDTIKISDKELFKTVNRQAKKIADKVEDNHSLLVADSFYSKGRTAEEEEGNDKNNAIINYQKSLEYYPDHELSQKALKRLQQ